MISPIRKRSHKRGTLRRGWKCSGDLYPGMHFLLERSSWCLMAASPDTIPYCVFIWVSACPEIFISHHLLASGCWAILLLSWLRNPTSRPKAKWLEAIKGKSRCALVRSLKVCPLLINQPRKKTYLYRETSLWLFPIIYIIKKRKRSSKETISGLRVKV